MGCGPWTIVRHSVDICWINKGIFKYWTVQHLSMRLMQIWTLSLGQVLDKLWISVFRICPIFVQLQCIQMGHGKMSCLRIDQDLSFSFLVNSGKTWWQKLVKNWTYWTKVGFDEDKSWILRTNISQNLEEAKFWTKLGHKLDICWTWTNSGRRLGDPHWQPAPIFWLSECGLPQPTCLNILICHSVTSCSTSSYHTSYKRGCTGLSYDPKCLIIYWWNSRVPCRLYDLPDQATYLVTKDKGFNLSFVSAISYLVALRNLA